jgi:hypothetical protein
VVSDVGRRSSSAKHGETERNEDKVGENGFCSSWFSFLVMVVRDLEVVDLRLKCWLLDFRFEGKSNKLAHRSS